ncbi:uncharacterized protein LOC101864647 [Aplysia californica]|uniref:Uncharacterized protein LOC101864647 n=1 Tax=Aplysia californica TaxID=6500 RepID=A0ABM0K0W1_APLCA|nr:uncharacterized protein LOC101864647 [Aplysia californica]
MSRPVIDPPPTTRPPELSAPLPAPANPSDTPAGETAIGGGDHCPSASPGYVTVQAPASLHHQVKPQNYDHGFDKRGKIVGCNQEVPYPFKNRHYHDVSFPRLVDWSSMKAGDEHKYVPAREMVKRSEVAEYFTADNDEGYNQWVARKAAEKKRGAELQKALRSVPAEIKALPGHLGPTATETSAGVIGQYLDLQPLPPAVYPLPAKLPPAPVPLLVRFRKSNMSDHPAIPDHAFAVDPRKMMTSDGCCYTRGMEGSAHYPETSSIEPQRTNSFKLSVTSLGQTVGERRKGFTWPLFTPTGLELNRPMPNRCVSVLAKSTEKEPVRLTVPSRTVPHVYKRYMNYSACPGVDKEAELNPARRPIKFLCAPYTPYPPQGNRLLDPCHQDFVSMSVLPLPVGLQKPSTC